MTAHPISTASKPQPNEQPPVLLLLCPDQSGWHTGVWWNDSWRLCYDIDLELEPTHWLPVPPDPKQQRDLTALFMGMREPAELA